MRKIRPSFVFFFLVALVAGSCERSGTQPAPALRARTLVFDPARIADPFGVAVRGEEVFVGDGESGKIFRVNRAGEAAVFAEGLDTPSQLAFDESGELYVADSGSHTIRRIGRDGKVEDFAGVSGSPGFADGAASEARFRAPVGIAVRGSRVFVADTYNDRIRVIENGRVTTLAGGARGFTDSDDGKSVRFDTPLGIAFGVDGSLLVCDSGNGRIRAVRANGGTGTIIGGGADFGDGDPLSAGLYSPSAIAVGTDGEIWFTDGNTLRRVVHSPLRIVTASSANGGQADGELSKSAFNHPSGIAISPAGEVIVADSENQAVRVVTPVLTGRELPASEVKASRPTAEQFRALAPPRWPYDPPERKREIAGTLGEIRGENDGSGENIWFHNGLDVVGAYGETARFIRDEKVLRANAAENFGTSRELLRMPTIGYIHIRLGRDSSEKPFDDPRFIVDRDETGKLTGVRIARGARFRAGEPIGTLNPMNHVHLIAGRSGSEMNALAALELPGVSDKIAPVIESVEFTDENLKTFETEPGGKRITIAGKTRIVAKAYDRMDGNAERRRLGIFRVGYQLIGADGSAVGDIQWTIRFDRLPSGEAVGSVYDRGSRSGATGETIFRYIVTNRVADDVVEPGALDTTAISPGNYTIRVFAADFFGNIATRDQEVAVAR